MSCLFLRRESLWIPTILLVILVGCWSELDLYAPSFPQMMHHFSTTEQMMQLTLSLNFFGFFFASLLCGPLADAFGRRAIILGGSIIFMIGSLICLLATTIEWMLFGRLVQGIGVSAPLTVAMAIIADIYQGDRQIKLLSRLNSTITIAMAMAPIVGVYLTDHWGYQASFVAIFLVALLGVVLIWLFIPETFEPGLRTKFAPKDLVKNYLTLLKSRDFMNYALGLCLLVTPYFVLIGILPLLFMEKMAISIHRYAFYQGSIVGLYALLSLLMPFILSRFDLYKIVRTSLALSGLGLGAAFIVSIFFADNPVVITAFMWIYIAGIIVPPTTMFVSAMDMFPTFRACASSLIQAMRMLSMSIGTAIAGMLYDGNFRSVGVVMLAFILVGIPTTMYSMRLKKKTHMLSRETMPALH